VPCARCPVATDTEADLCGSDHEQAAPIAGIRYAGSLVTFGMFGGPLRDAPGLLLVELATFGSGRQQTLAKRFGVHGSQPPRPLAAVLVEAHVQVRLTDAEPVATEK
jgi:hypothetical protein